jgi:nuclear pore complex protein Nup205
MHFNFRSGSFLHYKLHENRQQQLILQFIGGDSEAGSFSAERLYNILRNVLEGIPNNNHVELV